MKCPLCDGDGCTGLARDRRRVFFTCPGCGLVFVPESSHCTAEEERRRYDLHDNTALNSGYVRFLTEVADIASAPLPANARMLDFGCGREAVLAGLLADRGRMCDRYDPLYGYPFPADRGCYDAVILCEVIEHCRDVGAALRETASLLSGNGIVVIRTQCLPPDGDITRWWYAQDVTHVNFFSPRALEAAADILGRRLELTERSDVFIIR